MPTIDTLEMMRRLCDDPFLSEEEAAEGVVLTEEEEEDGERGERCGIVASGIQSGSRDVPGIGNGIPEQPGAVR